jgi:hypothetical protein
MPDPTSQKTTGDQSDDACNVDPVLQLAYARKLALMLWNQAQTAEAISTPPLEPHNNPVRYTGAYRRSMRFLDRALKIEDHLYDTVATTPAGLIFQAELLRDAVFPADHEGRRLLTNIISGIRAMGIHDGSGITSGDRQASREPHPLGSAVSFRSHDWPSNALGDVGAALATTADGNRAKAVSNGASLGSRSPWRRASALRLQIRGPELKTRGKIH